MEIPKFSFLCDFSIFVSFLLLKLMMCRSFFSLFFLLSLVEYQQRFDHFEIMHFQCSFYFSRLVCSDDILDFIFSSFETISVRWFSSPAVHNKVVISDVCTLNAMTVENVSIDCYLWHCLFFTVMTRSVAPTRIHNSSIHTRKRRERELKFLKFEIKYHRLSHV